jgi:hypothetical protein
MAATQRTHHELLALIDSLVADYGARWPAGHVISVVVRCEERTREHGGGGDLRAVERAARTKLAVAKVGRAKATSHR